MGMSHTLYRVTNHRIMQRVKQYQKLIESGGYIQIDDYHKTMAEHINNDFDSLYPTLIRYYNITLQSQEQVSSITSLRNKYYQETGFHVSRGHRSLWQANHQRFSLQTEQVAISNTGSIKNNALHIQ